MKRSENKTLYKSLSTTQKYENIVQVVEPIAQEAMAKKLVSFTVTVDSVVATATLIVDDSHKHLSLHWGDDLVEVINLAKLRHSSPQAGGQQEPNTLKFQHVYRPPLDYGRKIIIAVTTDSEGKKSYDTVVVEVVQRYKLSFYSIILEFPDHLDSSFESFSEVEARMIASQGGTIFFSNNWKDDVLTAPQIITGKPIQWRLNQSNFAREMSYSDEPICIGLTLEEHDGLGEDGGVLNTIWEIVSAPFRLLQYIPLPPIEFDTSTVVNKTGIPLKIHPKTSLSSSSATAVFKIPNNEGKIYATFYYDLNLIVPLDSKLERVMSLT
ncbi:hypothetical protein [Rheinheimera salexigens]|uniref:Uncharacterized protein n=1 Tax=Rheinheimera salexigens TaxID=1628148 RepID=A0A1E7Q6C3_9GAMM|nr:hypothetical protein [Rheinheimera salexigens]OEY69651.1 hypothetical protein BI198_08840 [Rheinheimera salexigens]